MVSCHAKIRKEDKKKKVVFISVKISLVEKCICLKCLSNTHNFEIKDSQRICLIIKINYKNTVHTDIPLFL